MAKTLDLEGAARFLHLSKEELRRRAKAGRIPAAKPGKRWVFLEDALAEYLRAQYAVPWQAASSFSVLNEEAPICCTNVVTSTGSTLRHPTASGLDVRLAQRTKAKPRSCTTGSRAKPGDRSN
ncbi:helix-turn-helix domain-containing protein [Acidithiobacillus albertensis]|uniref:helix-turn-helix domain-containing protein n=1 Tax=Acidithiobacillus albertensis TaxID=119978 RepID=UPI0038518201